MPTLYTTSPDTPIADAFARWFLAAHPPESRAEVVVFVPTRRAVVALRLAFQAVLGDAPSLLPKIFALAETEQAALTLLGAEALALFADIPPAMDVWTQRYQLTSLVMSYLRQQQGAADVTSALALAEMLMQLQDDCARSGVAFTSARLRGLVQSDMAAHWEQSLAFLAILAEHWPLLEQEMGRMIAPAREVALLRALTAHWQMHSPPFPIYAVGSTASQEATAELLAVIAQMPMGAVVLPGMCGQLFEVESSQGHPLFHVKQFLARWPEVFPIALDATLARAPSFWEQALTSADTIPQWRETPLPAYEHLRLVPCQHSEEEVRVIALLLREVLETPDQRVAVITPDEALLERVAMHMERYGITLDTLSCGTLARSEAGSLWLSLFEAVEHPERLLSLRALLHHPLLGIAGDLLVAMEPYWYGVVHRAPGQLPPMPESVRAHAAYARVLALSRALSDATRRRQPASTWWQWMRETVSLCLPDNSPAYVTHAELKEPIAQADRLGVLDIDALMAILRQHFAQPLRHAGMRAHPQIALLTPVEARLQQFDRVILAGMTDALWPGSPQPNPWLNLAAQAALGLPSPQMHVSRMAHDVLLLGSSPEVFLTWPLREAGSPSTRSRFIERAVARLAASGVPESALTASHYVEWARALYAAEIFAPSPHAMPVPPENARPTRLSVSALDSLAQDPFAFYAHYILQLKEIKALDAEVSASDLGSMVHRAIHALTLHWNAVLCPATATELAAIAQAELRPFRDRPATALFWETRLMQALNFVNDTEKNRRVFALQVQPEEVIEATLTLPQEKHITLHGKVDRLETGAGRVIVDYKTGQAPTSKAIFNGEALQMVAYALILGATQTDAIEYWKLPHGQDKGTMIRTDMEAILHAEIPAKLAAMLADMLASDTPFLVGEAERKQEYDGISRYGEWGE